MTSFTELRKQQRQALDKVAGEYLEASEENWIGLKARGEAGIARFLASDSLMARPIPGEGERPAWIRSINDWTDDDWQDYYNSLAAEAAAQSFE